MSCLREIFTSSSYGEGLEHGPEHSGTAPVPYPTKRLFADGTIPAAFKVTESTVTSKGVIIVNYERAGGIRAVLGI